MSIHIEFLKIRFSRMNFARSRKLRAFCLSTVHLLIVLSMTLSNLAFVVDMARAAEPALVSASNDTDYNPIALLSNYQEDEDPPLGNDDFDAAAFIDDPPYAGSMDTTAATTAGDDPVLSCTGETGSNSVWYVFDTYDDYGTLNVSTEGSGYNTVLAVWTGERGELEEVGCNDDAIGSQSSLAVTVMDETTYWIEIVQYGSPGGGQLELEVTFSPSIPPDNDDFDESTFVGELPYADSMDTTAATTADDDPEISCIDATGSNSVWYVFDTYEDYGTLNVTTDGSDYNTVLAVWTGERGELTAVGCNDNAIGEQSSLAVTAMEETTYWIEIVQYGSPGGGQLELEVTFSPSVPPDNDDFDESTFVGELPYTDSMDTTAATTADDDPLLSCIDATGSNSVWYDFQTYDDYGTLNVSTEGSDYNTVLAVWTGERGELTEVGCNDDAIGTQSSLAVTVMDETTYWIEIVQYGSPGGGQLELEVTFSPSFPPDNDDFDEATFVGELPYTDSMDTTAATTADDDPVLSCTGEAESNSVWYVFDTYEDYGTLNISTEGSDYDTVLAVWTGERGELTEVGCNDDAIGRQSSLAVTVMDETTYWIEIVQYGSPGGGQLELAVTFSSSIPPDNDDFYEAAFVDDPPYTDSMDTTAATTAGDDPVLSCTGEAESNSVWYVFTVEFDGTLHVSTEGSDYDTVLAVWTGERGELTEVGCNDNAIGEQSSLAVTAIEDTTYWIEVVQNGEPGGGQLQIRIQANSSAAPGEDLAELNAVDWGAEANGSFTTTITDDPTLGYFGDASVKFVTSAAFDWWAFYPGSRSAGWDLSSEDMISFWVKTENLNLFQEPITVRLGDESSGGYLEYRPTFDIYAQSSLPTGAQVVIPLSGDDTWELFQNGDVSLGKIDYFEIHADTRDAGFTLWLDGVYLSGVGTSNDHFEGATQVASLPFVEAVDTTSATTGWDDPAVSCGADEPATQSNSIWYKYSAASYEGLSISTSGSDYNTVIAVWTGERGELTEAACNNDADDLQAALTMGVVAGETYWIEVMQSSYPGGGQLQMQVESSPTIPGLRAEYYANISLESPIALTRNDGPVDFDWGCGSPAPEVGADNFSVRWTGQVEAEFSEAYTFHTLSDDGVRLWIDGVLIIDNWTVHGATWNTGAMTLLAGHKYDLKMEYFEAESAAVARLEWSSPSTPQDVIPADRLTNLNLGGSTVEASDVWFDEGEANSILTVTLATAGGMPIQGTPVYVQVSGSHNWLDGDSISAGEWVWMGDSGLDGRASATLASTVAEAKIVRARAEGMFIEDTAIVEFPPGEVEELQILLAGETTTPGDDYPGKSGTPKRVFVDQPAAFTVRAVDANWNLVTTLTGTVEISSTDPAADLPVSVDLVDGQATVVATWMTVGEQTLDVTHAANPSLVGGAYVEVLDTLVVGDGETVSVDDNRYALIEVITASATSLPFDGAVSILPGHEILVITMLGDGIGTYETAIVESVWTDTLTLSTPLANSYDGVNDKVMVQRVPYYPSVIVQDGGALTAHAWDGETGGVVFFRAEYVTVESGGTIDASGLGFRTGEGPGSGAGYTGGGGHGGHGGGVDGGGGYGHALEPVTLGGAGGSSNTSRTGGGVIRVVVSDTFLINGTVSSDGAQGSGYGGGGAGGSIWLDANTLGGAGIVQVNGGPPSYYNAIYGGGGGGRIAAYAVNNTYSGSWESAGGSYYSSSVGGPGTIYLEDTSTGLRKLIVDNDGLDGPPATLTDPAATVWAFDEIYLFDNGDLELLDPDDTITLTVENMAGDGTGQLYLHQNLAFDEPELSGFGFYLSPGVTLTVPADFTVRGVALTNYGTLNGGSNLTVFGGRLTNYGTLNGVSDLILAADNGVDSVVRLSAPGHSIGQPFGTYIFDTVDVTSGQTLELESDPENGQGVTIIAGNVSVASGGTIFADGLGYSQPDNPGPGAGTHPFNQPVGGGGHGGYGGGENGGQGYGSVLEPHTLGSAGGGSLGGNGGGAIKIIISDTLLIDGIMSANGAQGGAGDGGGAGGSIWLEVQTFSGAGTIRANGGDASYNSLNYGSGSGGRIAAYYVNSTFSGNWEAAGRACGADGGAGTIYLEDTGTGYRKLLVDNQDAAGPPAVITGTVAMVWQFDEIELLRNGNLELLNPGDTILLTAENMAGDGSGQLYLHQNTAFAPAELRNFGLHVSEGATLTLPESLSVQGVKLTNFGTLSDVLTLTLTADGTSNSLVRLAATGNTFGQESGVYAFGQILVHADQLMELESDAVSGRGVTLIADDITVAVDGAISADGLGYTQPDNPGPGAGGHTFTTAGGGGHGGRGGKAEGGSKYGSPDEPITPGSAGGDPFFMNSALGGSGGGAIKLVVSGTLSINGTLSTDGSQGDNGSTGGGAGGSIWLDAGILNGSGMIRANGGGAGSDFYDHHGAGGGGRIAAYAEEDLNSFNGTWEAEGGYIGADGDPGTIYLDGIISVYGFYIEILPENTTSPVLDVLQGEETNLIIVVGNDGLEELVNLHIVQPPYIPWVSVEPDNVATLALGETTSFTVTAAASPAQALGYYRDYITVTAISVSPELIALTVHVMAPTRSLSVTVENDQEQMVSGVMLDLTRQEVSVSVTRGMTETYHESFQITTNANGVVSLDGIETGTYDYTLSANYHDPVVGTLTIVEGSGTQIESMFMSALPALHITPTNPQFGVIQGQTKGQSITIANVGAATMTGLEIIPPDDLPWVSLGTPNPLPDIPPGESQGFTIFASPPITQTIGVYQEYVNVTADDGQLGIIALSVEVASESARNVEFVMTNQISQPITTTGRILLTRQEPAVLQLPGGEQVTYQPQFSQELDSSGVALFNGLEPGEYKYLVMADGYVSDSGQFSAQPGDGVQAQTISLQADLFTYVWTVIPMGDVYSITLHMTYEYDDDDPIPLPAWCLPPACVAVGNGLIWNYTGYGITVPPLVPPPSFGDSDEDEDRSTAELALSQDVMLEGEGFNAFLAMRNDSPGIMQDISVDIRIVDANLDNYTDSFTIIPGIPTDLGGLGSGDELSHDWVILPTGLNLTDPAGEMFLVSASIQYTLANQHYEFGNARQWITVFPAPDLTIHYKLPSPDEYCTAFDFSAEITNQGLGAARNLRFNSTVPQVVAPDDSPISFDISNVTVNGISHGPELNLVLGDLAPGGTFEVIWRLNTNTLGRFTALSAEYTQNNPDGLPLTPLISSVTTELVDGPCTIPEPTPTPTQGPTPTPTPTGPTPTPTTTPTGPTPTLTPTGPTPTPTLTPTGPTPTPTLTPTGPTPTPTLTPTPISEVNVEILAPRNGNFVAPDSIERVTIQALVTDSLGDYSPDLYTVVAKVYQHGIQIDEIDLMDDGDPVDSGDFISGDRIFSRRWKPLSWETFSSDELQITVIVITEGQEVTSDAVTFRATFPDYLCGSSNLSHVGMAVWNVLGPQYSCLNTTMDDLIILPPGDDAFQKYADVILSAQYEVDFANMIWDGETPLGIIAGGPTKGIRGLYEKVMNFPSDYYPHGMRVRILLGGPKDRDNVIDALTAKLVPLGPTPIDPNDPKSPVWQVELAYYHGPYPVNPFPSYHSHVKLLVVDGQRAIIGGYNVQENYFYDNPLHDMGVYVAGPIGIDALYTFDRIWEHADVYGKGDVGDVAAILHAPQVWEITIPGGDYVNVFSQYRDRFDDTGEDAVVAAIETSEDNINIIQTRFTVGIAVGSGGDVFYTLPFIHALANAITWNADKPTYRVRVLFSGGLELPVNNLGVADLLLHIPPSEWSHFEARVYVPPMHTKALTVDDTFLIVGSQNWDGSSWRGDVPPGKVKSPPDIAEYDFGIDYPQDPLPGDTVVSQFNDFFKTQWETSTGIHLYRMGDTLLYHTEPDCDAANPNPGSLQDVIENVTPQCNIVMVGPGEINLDNEGSLLIDRPTTLTGMGSETLLTRSVVTNTLPLVHINSSDVTVQGFTFWNNNGYAIEIGDGSSDPLKNIFIAYSVFADNSLGGIKINGPTDGSPLYYTIQNNTFVGGESGITINVLGAQDINAVVSDNIFSGQSLAPVVVESADDGGVDYAYNLFDNCTRAAGGVCPDDWLSGSLHINSTEAHNLVNLDTGFNDPGNGDYSLNSVSAAIDAGDSAATYDLTLDGDGDNIPRPDIGAGVFGFYPAETRELALLEPANGQGFETSLGTPITVTLNWKTTFTQTVDYNIQVARDGQFLDLIFDASGHSTTMLTAHIMPGVYYWRVATSAMPDDWSLVRQFIVKGPETYFFDDMEEERDEWLESGDWALTETDSHSPTHAYSLNPNEDYQRNTDYSLELTPTVSIHVDAARPELIYSDHFSIAPDTNLFVEVTTDDGLTWTPVVTSTSTYNRPDWVLRRVPLDAFTEETIRVRFRAVQGNGWHKDHWYVDDVRIGERVPLPDLGFPFEEPVTATLGNWEPDGQWAIVDTGGYIDAYAWSLNPENEYQRNTNFAVELAGQINVPTNTVRPELTYYDRLTVASDTILYVEVTTDDGLTWETEATFTSAYNRSDWILRRVSLDGYHGKTILLRFRALQGSDWTRDHWCIDNLRIGEHQTPPALTFPFEDDLESGSENWEFGGQWSAISGDAYSGDYTLTLNPTNDYQRNTDFAFELAGLITVPADTVRPELTYYDRLTVASDTTLYIEATSDDGLTWTELTRFTSAYNRSDWVLRRLSLDGYQGEVIRLRFRAVQGSDWTKDIWLLDDIRIGEHEAPPDLSFPFKEPVTGTLENWEPGGQWAIVDTGGYTDDYALSLNPTYDYQRNTDFSVELAGTVTIPLTTTLPELTYYDHFDVASDTTLSVDITTDDGLSWTTLLTFTYAENRPDWVLRAISLDGYQGQSVRIRFRAVQGSDWTNDHWYVDNVTIAEQEAPPQGNFPFEEPVTGTLENWEPGGQWDIVGTGGYNDEYAWDVNPNNEYQRNTDFSLELATAVDIPADAVRPELSYYDHFSAASDTSLYVEITTDDGLTWTPVVTSTSASNRSDWVLRRVPLDDFTDETVRLRFRAVQGSSWTRDHWYIDNLRIGERQAPLALAFPFVDDLENGSANWEFGGQWSAVSGDAYSSDYALSLNPTNDYQRSTDFTVELVRQITIPTDTLRPELTYYDRLTVASDTTLYIEATSDDGLTWTELTRFTSAYNRSDWILRRVSLNGYQGDVIRLRFRAVQGSDWTKDVWLIDDLYIGECQTQTLAFPFEDPIPDLLIPDYWEPDGQWSIVDTGGYNDDYAWSLNPTNDYQRNTDFSLTLGGLIEISADAVQPKLGYSDHFTITSDTTLYIEISNDDGQNWSVLSTFTSVGNSSEWTIREVPLDAYAGETIRFRFRAVQGSAWYKDHWIIDDVRVDT